MSAATCIQARAARVCSNAHSIAQRTDVSAGRAEQSGVLPPTGTTQHVGVDMHYAMQYRANVALVIHQLLTHVVNPVGCNCVSLG